MKVIFLDVDGVLNDGVSMFNYEDDKPTKEHMACLKEIIDVTDAKVVLSSTWRLFPGSKNIVKNCLRNIGSDIFDITKELPKGRGAEIQEWLNRHPEVCQFVILDDDDSDMQQFSKNTVKTSFYRGLLPEHVKMATDILNAE